MSAGISLRMILLKSVSWVVMSVKEEGSSATDCVTDVTDVTDGRKEEGRKKKGEGRRNTEDGRIGKGEDGRGKTEGGRDKGKRQEERRKRRKGRGNEKFFWPLPIFISHC